MIVKFALLQISMACAVLLEHPRVVSAAELSPEGIEVAATFIDDRVYVDMPVPGVGAPLHLFTDSGGGSLILSQHAASRLGLAMHPVTDRDVLAELGPEAQIAPASAFINRNWPGVPTKSEFTVIPAIIPVQGWPAFGDGVLGRQWFAGHLWTWDYTHHRLILRPSTWRPPPDAHPLEVSFKNDSTGRRLIDFPRVMVRISGEELPMLFDTGATTMLTPAARKALADGRPALRATSMMSKSIFDRWRLEHPDWRVIDDAQLSTHSRMILVPGLEIAGQKIGPVWFTERSDHTYHDFMSSMMSARMEGSIGGNALSNLAISIDYLKSLAWIQAAHPLNSKRIFRLRRLATVP